MDLSKIFIYAYQRNLRDKVKSKDSSLRVIAIPELSKFFMPPIPLDQAIDLYRFYEDQKQWKIEGGWTVENSNKGEFNPLVAAVCHVCQKEEMYIDKGIEDDEMPKGWIGRYKHLDNTLYLYCSPECLEKDIRP